MKLESEAKPLCRRRREADGGIASAYDMCEIYSSKACRKVNGAVRGAGRHGNYAEATTAPRQLLKRNSEKRPGCASRDLAKCRSGAELSALLSEYAIVKRRFFVGMARAYRELQEAQEISKPKSLVLRASSVV